MSARPEAAVNKNGDDLRLARRTGDVGASSGARRAVRLAERRDDPRVREIDELARRNGRPSSACGCASAEAAARRRRASGCRSRDHSAATVVGRRSAGRAQTETHPLILALDGVQDPHNLGACLRTADACGALAVIVPHDRAAQSTPTVRKVAVGAAETTPVVAVTNLVGP